MKFEGSVEVAAPREAVWRTLLDPQAMAKIVPGVRDLEVIGPNEFRGRVQMGIGALRGVFTAAMKLSDLVPPSDARLTMQGRGSLGEFAGTGTLHLDEDGGATKIAYAAELQLGGPMAGMGEALMWTVSQALIAQGLKNLAEACRNS